MIRQTTWPETLERFNNLPSVKIIGAGVPGISSGQIIAEVERLARETLPPDFSFDWGGASFQEKKSSGSSSYALVLGALMAFLIPPRNTNAGRCRWPSCWRSPHLRRLPQFSCAA